MVQTLGTVWIDDFDRGVVTTIGASLFDRTVDGVVRQDYCVEIVGVSGPPEFGGRVPVFRKNPSDPNQQYLVPCIVVSSTAPVPALDRSPSYGWASRMPADGAEKITVDLAGQTVVGYSKYAQQWQGDSYDIGYEVSLRARREREQGLLFKHMLKIMKAPSFTVVVLDSLGEKRGYDAVGLSWSDDTELAGVVNRTVIKTASFDVRAELDVEDVVVVDAVTKVPQAVMVSANEAGLRVRVHRIG